MKGLHLLSVPVVGIGASAGGLDSLMRLLPRLLPSGRIRYIVAQHMAKDGHSELVVKVLGRVSGLPIMEARDGDVVEPDRIYLIPSSYDGILRGGRIHLQPPESGQPSTPSVNVLFCSIANDAGRHAVGVILSGAGSDGVTGCKAIKSKGGRVLVQSRDSAQISGMSDAVDRALLADERLTPEAIADRINALMPTVASSTVPPLPGEPCNRAPELRTLLQGISRATGINFLDYKEETLLRRLGRRMESLRITDVASYLTHAQRHPSEMEILKHLFMVSLSWFFRDRPAFDKLSECVAQRLAAKREGEPVNVWVVGCATGEECYSIAILLAELMRGHHGHHPIVITGSDLNPDALDVARNGRYNTASFREMPGRIMERYFTTDGDRYFANDDIRSFCSFREEDVMSAEPPPSLDLISCRNLFIYMKNDLQGQMIEKFYRALRPEGLLFLGLSENIGHKGSARFAALDSNLRVYRRKTFLSER